MTRDHTVRRLGLALLAVAMAVGLVAAPPSARDVAAATPDLTLVTDARYEVQPKERRVRVGVDIVATNRLRDTATRRFYFDRAFLAVPPGSTGFRLTGGSGKPRVKVSQKRDAYQVLELSFGQRIYSRKSARFRLTFDLPDPGGVPTRDVRVGESFVAFPVWAYASEETPGSTVTVVFPKGYNVSLEVGELPQPTTGEGGSTVYASGKLDAPLSFFAYFIADRPGSFDETPVEVAVGDREAQLTVRAWPDDPDWAARVADLMERGLPALHRLVGLEWPRDEALVVQETVSRTTGGYAGLFDPREGRIEVAYYADPFVILHEAAHAWFNGQLLADRWANEAFASYYAQIVGTELSQEMQIEELSDELREAAFPLNAWAPAGRGDATAEDYGYAASLELARAIAQRASLDGLRRVWAAAARGEAAYQPPPVDPGTSREPEPADGPPDWRGLLDLLEDRTGRPYGDLWREWVVRDGEADLLEERAAARATYEAVLQEAGRWELPPAIRGALRAWQFDTAEELLAEARAVLDRRRDLEEAAAEAGLRLPPNLETVFESDAGFEAAHAEADAEEATIDLVRTARAAREQPSDVFEEIGLLGETPDQLLASAGERFAAGELQAAAQQAIAAHDVWVSAGDVGRKRVLIAIGVALLALLAAVLLVGRWRERQRRRRRLAAIAAPATGRSPEATGLQDLPETRVPEDGASTEASPEPPSGREHRA